MLLLLLPHSALWSYRPMPLPKKLTTACRRNRPLN